MATEVTSGQNKRLRGHMLAGALFLCAVLTFAGLKHSPAQPDLLTGAERAWLAAHPVIRLAPDPDFPPVEYFDQRGTYRGITADYVALLEKKLGIRITIVRLPTWDAVVSRSRSRDVDVYVATATPQRARYLNFSRPFLTFPASIIVRNSAEKHLSLDNLRGMKVSVVSEYAAHHFIANSYPDITLDLVPDVQTGLRKVSFGLSDAFVESLATATYFIEQEGITNLRVAGDSGYFYRMGFCSRKDWPELSRILDKGLAAITAQEKHAIYKKWIPFEPQSLLNDPTVRAGVALVVAVALLALVWNRVLSRQVRLRTDELVQELAERRKVEAALQAAHDGLEQRVAERTAELAETVRALRFTQFAVDRSGDQAFWITSDGHFFYVNDAACTALGYAREELLAMAVWDIDPLWTQDVVVQYWRRLRELGTDTFESTHRARDGREYPVEIRTNLLVFEGGEFTCTFVTDITERKRAERELRESALSQRKLAEELARRNQFLRTLMDAIPDLIFYKDCTGKYLGCNRAFEAFANCSELELLGSSVRDIFGDTVADAFQEADLDVVNNEESRRFVEWIDYPDGRRVLLETLKMPFFNLDGEVLGVVGVSRDITMRARMEEDLLLSYFCINEAAIGILQVSLDDGTIKRVNYSACRMLGYAADELCAMTIFDIVSGLSWEDFAAEQEMVQQSGALTIEGIHRRKDGSTYPVEITANNLQFQGKMYGFAFFRDISERKAAEAALRESEVRVRQKLASILDPDDDMEHFDLADILDVPQVQDLMEELFRLTGFKMSIIDLQGNVLVDVGWQEICRRFHRTHPDALRGCHESDTELADGVPPGQFRTYRCRNNMWHIVTPIMVGGKHLGNLFMGQFFYADEQIDYELFRAQAHSWGFPEEAYRAALDAVPRYTEEMVDLAKALFLRLTHMFSRLSYANIKLAHTLAERERLTATLREAAMVVENSPAVLFRWKGDTAWPVELVSGNIRQFGYAADEFLSGALNYIDIVHPADCQRLVDEVQALCREGSEQYRLEYRILTKEGAVRWVNEHGNVERDAFGAVTHFEGIVMDVTERKLFEEELERQKVLLQSLNETLEQRVREEVARNREKDIMLIQQNRQAALGELLDHIAHQWKQPITSLYFVMHDLFDGVGADMVRGGQLQDSVSVAISLLDHMMQTMEMFRDFYRPDKEKKIFNIKEAVDQALSFTAPAFRYHAIAVELDVDPGLTAFGYPKEYAQVLLNILSNARDVFRARGTVAPRVIIRAFALENWSVVTVEDNAGGIPEDIIGRIFEFYFTTNAADGGTGIGLYMSRNIIEKSMGGTLRAENTGNGALFSIAVSLT